MIMKVFPGRACAAALIVALLVVAGCAHRPPASDPEALAEYKQKNDPLEPLNRATLQFNEALDKVLFRPLALGYRYIFPQFFRKMIENFMRNLRNPIYFGNDLLQGDGRQAGVTLGRLVVNSTIGIGGLFDPATGMGLKHRNEDFGQTLGVWGVGEGFYLVLPILGPSSARDGLGFGVDILMDPFTYVLFDGKQKYLRYARYGIEGLDLYERNLDTLDELRKSSLDYYSALRSYYRQFRADKVRNGAEVPAKDLQEFDEFDEFDDDTGDDGSAQPDGTAQPQGAPEPKPEPKKETTKPNGAPPAGSRPEPQALGTTTVPPLDLAPRHIP